MHFILDKLQHYLRLLSTKLKFKLGYLKKYIEGDWYKVLNKDEYLYNKLIIIFPQTYHEKNFRNFFIKYVIV